MHLRTLLFLSLCPGVPLVYWRMQQTPRRYGVGLEVELSTPVTL